MITETEHLGREHQGGIHPTTIFVNRKPVVICERNVTGAEFKAAAIAQGIAIQAD